MFVCKQPEVKIGAKLFQAFLRELSHYKADISRSLNKVQSGAYDGNTKELIRSGYGIPEQMVSQAGIRDLRELLGCGENLL